MNRLLLCSACVMLAVSVSPAIPSAQQTPEGPAFEVAALHLSAPPYGGGLSPIGLERWSANGVGLGFLLTMAFDLRPYVQEMIGLPDWAKRERYSIAVKAEDGVLLTPEAMRPRMKRLLEERFKLVTHIETRNAKGFALVVANGGSKLTPTTTRLAKTAIASNRVIGPSVTMDLFAGALESLLNRQTRAGVPVVNETGLAGTYDVVLSFAPEGAIDSPLPSLFTALQEQLGLRLVSREGIPVPTLVVDQVEHPTVD